LQGAEILAFNSIMKSSDGGLIAYHARELHCIMSQPVIGAYREKVSPRR
jgi:hypothetical protein